MVIMLHVQYTPCWAPTPDKLILFRTLSAIIRTPPYFLVPHRRDKATQTPHISQHPILTTENKHIEDMADAELDAVRSRLYDALGR